MKIFFIQNLRYIFDLFVVLEYSESLLKETRNLVRLFLFLILNVCEKSPPTTYKVVIVELHLQRRPRIVPVIE